MAVRVKMKLISVKNKSAIEVNSVLNTAFESEGPEVLVPLKVAEELSFWPMLPEGAIVKAFETTGGIVRMYYITDAVETQVITQDKLSKPAKCALVISEIEREVLVSDRAIDELDIVIESPGKGLWRFRNEGKIRSSVEPQYW